MKAKNNEPLVTAIFLSYNHEKFLDKSISSLLNQTYQNLEVIISDDNSSDNSFEVIKSLVNSGDTRVILNRNEINLGIAAHLNKIMEQVRGELCVVFAGDDVSTNDRIEKLVSFWQSNGKPDSVFSSVWTIDSEDNICGEKAIDERKFLCKRNKLISELIYRSTSIIGCSHAWTTSSYRKFGDLSADVINEDRTIAFRSALGSGIGYLAEKLVYYRIDSGISNIKNDNNYSILFNYNKVNSQRELIDLEQNKSDASKFNDRKLTNLIESRVKEVELLYHLSRNSLTFIELIRIIFSNARLSRIIKALLIYGKYKFKNL